MNEAIIILLREKKKNFRHSGSLSEPFYCLKKKEIQDTRSFDRPVLPIFIHSPLIDYLISILITMATDLILNDQHGSYIYYAQQFTIIMLISK